METLNSAIVLLNSWGRVVCDFAGRMLVQSSILIGLLLIADVCLRRRASARFRYAMWLLVLVKLVLPPSLALPTGAAYWLGRYMPATPAISELSPVTGSLVLPPYIEPRADVGAAPVSMVQTVAEPRVLPLQGPGLALLGWVAGVLLLLALVLWQIVAMRRSLARSRPAGAQMIALLEDCRAELGIAVRVRIMLTNDLHSPAVCGFLRPVILLPAVLVPMGRASTAALPHRELAPGVPALPKGIPELFGRSKDSILEKFGEPKHIFYGDQVYTLESLPMMYYMAYEDLSFRVQEDMVAEITLLSPDHVLGNGVRVGDSEEKVKQAFGPDYRLNPTEFKDFLIYEDLGINFEIHKQDRSVMEINIDYDYGDPARLEAQARAGEFSAQLPQKIAQINIDSADLKQVLAVFGEPVKYAWGPKTFSADRLPDRFIAVYPGSFRVFMMNDRIVELRFEQGSTYAYAGKLRIGATLEEALAVLGAPARTVEGKPISWSDSQNVLFKDIEGRKGHCYYHRPDQGVRVWFGNYKVAAIYMTRSDYGADDPVTPADAEFARLLQTRVAALNIDSAGPEQIKAIFGEPTTYVWGSQTLKPDALPDRYVMNYPYGFCVFMMGDRIMEIRHERHRGGSPYVYRGTLRIGSTIEEAVALLGEPTETVTDQENQFKDGVLYRYASGDGYYHRSDQKVRLFFGGGKVIAIYMTRSDFPVH